MAYPLARRGVIAEVVAEVGTAVPTPRGRPCRSLCSTADLSRAGPASFVTRREACRAGRAKPRADVPNPNLPRLRGHPLPRDLLRRRTPAPRVGRGRGPLPDLRRGLPGPLRARGAAQLPRSRHAARAPDLGRARALHRRRPLLRTSAQPRPHLRDGLPRGALRAQGVAAPGTCGRGSAPLSLYASPRRAPLHRHAGRLPRGGRNARARAGTSGDRVVGIRVRDLDAPVPGPDSGGAGGGRRRPLAARRAGALEGSPRLPGERSHPPRLDRVLRWPRTGARDRVLDAPLPGSHVARHRFHPASGPLRPDGRGGVLRARRSAALSTPPGCEGDAGLARPALGARSGRPLLARSAAPDREPSRRTDRPRLSGLVAGTRPRLGARRDLLRPGAALPAALRRATRHRLLAGRGGLRARDEATAGVGEVPVSHARGALDDGGSGPALRLRHRRRAERGG